MAHLPNGKWIPDSTARQYKDMRGQYGAELGAMLESGSAVTEEWNRVLYQIDPDLRLVRAKENADHPGLTPGLYDVLRRNPLGAPTLCSVSGPNGEFNDPDSSLLDALRRMDLWNGRAQRDQARANEELDRQKARQKEREREERQDEIAERWKAASNPGVSFTDVGWRYRAGAPR